MAKNKYYVVWEGHQVGIYFSWPEASKQIKNYPGARYKSYTTMEKAENAYQLGWKKALNTSSNKTEAKERLKTYSKIIKNSISVDAACSGNPGDMEYRGVKTETEEEIFRVGPLKMGTNNVGEFLALVHVLALLKKMGRTDIPIYSDSKIAIGWIYKKKANTKLKKTKINTKLFDLLERAHTWLSTNKIENPIHKWETKSWGEIPADFGRK